MKPTPSSWRHIDIAEYDGVVEARLHSEGKSLIWSAAAEDDLVNFLGWLKSHQSTKVLLLTHAGEDFCFEIDATEFRQKSWRGIWQTGRSLLCTLLELEILVISALTGRAHIHSEIPMLADIVLAAPDVTFADKVHFVRNVAPGDGVNLVWAGLLGSSRASYYLLTGAELTAQKAEQCGVIHELIAHDRLLPRAQALARELAAKPSALIAYTRAALRIRDRQKFRDDLSHGLALEGLAQHALGFRGPE